MSEIKPVYLFYGEERFLVEKDLAFFRRHFSASGDTFAIRDYDGHTAALADVLDDAETPPFFAPRQLLIVDHAPWFKGDAGDTGDLARYLDAPAEFTCLVFVADEVDKRRKLFKAVSANGKVRAYARLSRWELVKYVRDLCRRQGKRIGGAEAELLLHLLPEDLATVHGEVEKLITYLGDDEEISEDMILRLVAKSQAANNFQLSDALGERDLARLLPVLRDVLSHLARDKQMALHGYLVNFLRLLLRARALREQGQPVTGKSLGVHDFRAKKLAEAARHYEIGELTRGLSLLLDLDYKVKSGQVGFAEGLFETLTGIALPSGENPRENGALI